MVRSTACAPGVLSDQRIAELPNVPTLKELGKDVSLTVWFRRLRPQGHSPGHPRQALRDGQQGGPGARVQGGHEEGRLHRPLHAPGGVHFLLNKQYGENKKLLQMIGVKAK